MMPVPPAPTSPPVYTGPPGPPAPLTEATPSMTTMLPPALRRRLKQLMRKKTPPRRINPQTTAASRIIPNPQTTPVPHLSPPVQSTPIPQTTPVPLTTSASRTTRTWPSMDDRRTDSRQRVEWSPGPHPTVVVSPPRSTEPPRPTMDWRREPAPTAPPPAPQRTQPPPTESTRPPKRRRLFDSSASLEIVTRDTMHSREQDRIPIVNVHTRIDNRLPEVHRTTTTTTMPSPASRGQPPVEIIRPTETTITRPKVDFDEVMAIDAQNNDDDDYEEPVDDLSDSDMYLGSAEDDIETPPPLPPTPTYPPRHRPAKVRPIVHPPAGHHQNSHHENDAGRTAPVSVDPRPQDPRWQDP
ncbi:hypothetical protein GCK32_019296, partial [Trichostrongylus colubriformis]